jgi:pimeloyl-ACP methyl ester carboxylesterase
MSLLRRVFIITFVLLFLFLVNGSLTYASANFITPSISDISNGQIQHISNRPGFPVGYVNFKGILFYIPETGNNYLDMQASSFPDHPKSGKISVFVRNPEEIYFLLTSGNTFSRFQDKKIGEIILGFEDGTVLSQELKAGIHIREWFHRSTSTINTTTSDLVQEVWKSTTTPKKVVDMLKLPLAEPYKSKILTSIEVEDTSFETVESYDPAVHWIGVSIKYCRDTVILIPGLGACWDYGAMLGNTEGTSWHIPAFVRSYKRLGDTLNKIYSDSEFFTFCYDFRKPVAEIAPKLKEFINTKIPQGEKVDLIGHSMGGLIAREYLQQNPDHRTAQVITLGSPHEGVVKAYGIWEGGEIWEGDPVARAFLEFLIWNADKLEQNPREIIWERVRSVKDLLPTFEFLDHGSGTLEALKNQKNDWLLERNQEINGAHKDRKQVMATVYGQGFDTLKNLKVQDAPWWDWALGNWPDGKPILKAYTNEGDDSVLVRSARIEGTRVDSVSTNHGGLVDSQAGIEKILSLLGQNAPLEPETPLFKNILWFRVRSPAKIKVPSLGDNGEYDEANKLVVLGSSDSGQLEVSVLGEAPGGNYTLDVAQIASDSSKLIQIKGEISEGVTDKFSVDYKLDKPEELKILSLDKPSELMALESAKLKLLAFKNELLGKNFDGKLKEKSGKIIDKVLDWLNEAEDLIKSKKYKEASDRIEKAIIDLYFLERILKPVDEEVFSFVSKRIEEISQDLQKVFLETSGGQNFNRLKIGAKIKLVKLKLKIVDGLNSRILKWGMVGKNKAMLYLLASGYLKNSKEALEQNNLPLAYIAAEIARRLSMVVEVF